MKKIILILFYVLIIIFAGLFLTFEVYNFNKLKSASIDELEYFGKLYSKLNLTNMSLRFFNKAIELNPNIIDFYVYKASVMKADDALNFINNVALQKFPNDEVLYFQIATIYYKNNKITQALNVLDDKFIDSSNFYVHFLYGKCYSDLYKFNDAVKSFTKVIELNPDYDEAYILRAKSNGNLGLWNKTLADYEFLKKKYPNSEKYYFLTSLYKINTKDYQGALKDTDKAIELSGREQSYLYANKAWIYYEMGDYDKSKGFLEKALKLDKFDQYANELVVFLAYENNDYKSVIKYSNISMKKALCDNYAALSIRAKAFYKLGNKKEALKIMDSVLQLVPYDKEYIQLRENILNDKEIVD